MITYLIINIIVTLTTLLTLRLRNLPKYDLTFGICYLWWINTLVGATNGSLSDNTHVVVLWLALVMLVITSPFLIWDITVSVYGWVKKKLSKRKEK